MVQYVLNVRRTPVIADFAVERFQAEFGMRYGAVDFIDSVYYEVNQIDCRKVYKHYIFWHFLNYLCCFAK